MDLPENLPRANEHDLFEENEFVHYELASYGQRFGNYFIDALFMQFALSFATVYVLVQLLPPATTNSLLREGNLAGTYAIALLNHLLYYSVCEKVFQGVTLGKLVTGTKAIREDGGELTYKDALLRTLSRVVPFEVLSGWISGEFWHDKWTNTRVIKTR